MKIPKARLDLALGLVTAVCAVLGGQAWLADSAAKAAASAIPECRSGIEAGEYVVCVETATSTHNKD